MSATSHLSCFLCRNKSDLSNQREVPNATGLELSHVWNCPFLEASAKEMININEVFIEAVREMNVVKSGSSKGCCSVM